MIFAMIQAIKSEGSSSAGKNEAKYFKWVLLLYAFLALLLFGLYQHKLYPDTISYVSIAEHYLKGAFYDAINGYFAPAYSWLLIPFLAIGLSKLMSAKILSVLIGFVTLIPIKRISHQIEISDQMRRLILFVSVPMLLYFAFSFDTPDLLLVCILLFYLNTIYDSKYIENRKVSIIAGVLGAFAYFSKHYAFPFFISHFILMNGIFYFRSKDSAIRKKVLQNFALGMIAFLLLSGTWIGLMSYKYNKFTISNSASYVYALMAPDTKGHPVGREGFLDPSNKNATSAWEDPSKIKVEGWSPLKSLELLKHQIKLSLNFINRILSFLGFFSMLSITIIIAEILFLLPLNSNTLKERDFYILVTFFLFTFGYVLIFPVERYLWVTSILILILGGSALNKLFQSRFFEGTRKNLTILFFVISFWIYPIYTLALEINKGDDVYSLSKKLRQYKLHGNVASQAKYKTPLYLSFYLDLKYFGPSKDGIGCKELYDDLRTNDIDYYFVWNDHLNKFQSMAEECDDLLDFEEITNGAIPQLRIYDVKNKP